MFWGTLVYMITNEFFVYWFLVIKMSLFYQVLSIQKKPVTTCGIEEGYTESREKKIPLATQEDTANRDFYI